MKFNWGTGIAIFLTAFILFILSLVYMTTTIETDLVADDYYKQELAFQERIDAKKRGMPLGESLQIAQNRKGLIIECDPSVFPAMHAGEIAFYRPDDPRLDRTFALDLSTGQQILSSQELLPGLYEIKFIWKVDEELTEIKKPFRLARATTGE